MQSTRSEYILLIARSAGRAMICPSPNWGGECGIEALVVTAHGLSIEAGDLAPYNYLLKPLRVRELLARHGARKANPSQLRRSAGSVRCHIKLATVVIDSIVAQRECFEGICGRDSMPKYLVQASYTAEGLSGLQKEGATSRVQNAQMAAEAVGGKCEAFYWAFGEQDVVAIFDVPNIS
jgi:GYD domain-containing protein